MSKTDDLRATFKAPIARWLRLLELGDIAVIDGKLYAVVRAHIGIGVDNTRKVIYKESETLVRLIMPDPWPDA